MLISKREETNIIKSIKSGDGRYQIVGKVCDGNRWPEGNHYLAIDDLVNQRTIHIPVDRLGDIYHD